MKRSSKFLASQLPAWPALGGALLVLGAVSWSGPAAQAQNIDAGKSAQRLFADSCVNCHRTPSNLAKGRFRPTLFLFLQDHYTASMGAAWELSSYLASVDTTGKGRSKKGAAHSPTRTSGTAAGHGTSPRPPAAVRPN
jgi:mono/diheme cytochrome c family protein